jgi:STE24 endopeptidase
MEEYLIIIFIAYLLVVSFGYWLDYLNINYLKRYGSVIPPEFEGKIDDALLRRTNDYTVENTKFDFISSLFNNMILLIFIFAGPLNIYNTWVASLRLPFIISGLIFFMLLFYAETILSLPFSLYRTFKIEKKYGFSTMTFRLWLTDLLKSLLISTILLSILISVGLYLVQKSPELWWFWVWCFFFLFSIFIIYISPYIIEPLFHRFTPIEDESLNEGIRNLMQKVSLKVSRVFKMDASRRTRHTNAYFAGIGKVKRIILYDTLLEGMENKEILSVLAHEAGHWKRRHLLKFIIFTECIALIVMYISFRILRGDFLINLFNIDENTFFAKVVVLAFLGSIISVLFTPVFNYFSRRYEEEADRFSYKLTGDSQGMVSALVKLSKDNLSNLYPHPLYAFFHYSHPPVLERIRKIRSMK